MIKFEDVFFQYSSSKKTALSNINLEIKEGRWLSVLGKNGSGKSTLMKLIYGQNLATSLRYNPAASAFGPANCRSFFSNISLT